MRGNDFLNSLSNGVDIPKWEAELDQRIAKNINNWYKLSQQTQQISTIMIYDFEGHTPKIDPGSWVAPNAVIIGRVEVFFDKVIFRNAFISLLFGLILTSIVQSSSITTSLIVPLVGAGILTLEQIERRTLAALGSRRFFVRLPMPLLVLIVTLMEKTLPAPPVSRGLLELLAVSNVPTDNALSEFVSDPRSFTSKNIAPYMDL